MNDKKSTRPRAGGENTFHGLARRLAARGYEPVAIVPGTKRPVGDDWPRRDYIANPPDVDGPVGVRNVSALDIDIADPTTPHAVDLLAALQSILAKHMPSHLVRHRGGGGFIVPLHLDDAITGRYVETWRADGEAKTLELDVRPARKHQFVAYGLHPSGVEYTWSPAGLLDVPASELPRLDEAKFLALWRDLTGYVATKYPTWQRGRLFQSDAEGRQTGVNYANAEESIRQGINYHDATLLLTRYGAQSGLSEADTLSWLNRVYSEAPDDQRRHARQRDLPRIVAQTFEKFARDPGDPALDFDKVDIPSLKAESAQIGDGDVGLPPAEVIARYNIRSLEQMVERFAYAEHGGLVVDIERPKLTMSLSNFRAATAALVLPNPTTGLPAPMADAWLRHPARRTVVTTTFYPGKPEVCWAVEEGAGYDAVNIWRPVAHVAPEGWAGRVAPFLDHLAYLVPIEAERGRFLDWLAHIEQYPADRPHAHYLMVATTQGIGRSYIGSALARVWPGFTALNFDLVRMLTSGFSGRLSGKLLAVVDEIAEGGKGGDRWAHAETMKSLLSSETIDINVKYGAQRVERNCIRFLMFSNHVSAIPLDAADRRWHVIRNPSVAMAADYYTKLYGLLRDPAYIAALREMLRQRDLSRYNPHERPAMNEAKRDLVAASQTDDEHRFEEFLTEYPYDLIRSTELLEVVTGVPGLSVMADPERVGKASARLRHMVHRHGGGAYRKTVKMPDADGSNKVSTNVTILRNYGAWSQQEPHDVRRALLDIDHRRGAAAALLG